MQIFNYPTFAPRWFFTSYVWHLTRTQQSPLPSPCRFREWGCTPVKIRNHRRNRHLIHSLSRCAWNERWKGERARNTLLLGPTFRYTIIITLPNGALLLTCAPNYWGIIIVQREGHYTDNFFITDPSDECRINLSKCTNLHLTGTLTFLIKERNSFVIFNKYSINIKNSNLQNN